MTLDLPTWGHVWGHGFGALNPGIRGPIRQRRYFVRMTAKEQLRQTVEELSEAEAQDALGFIVRRRDKRDALAELLERAPLDDEPTTPDEDQSAREAKEQVARGEVISADEIRREIA